MGFHSIYPIEVLQISTNICGTSVVIQWDDQQSDIKHRKSIGQSLGKRRVASWEAGR